MSTQTHDRWFLTPAVRLPVDDSGGDVLTAKYTDADGLTGWSGQTIDPATVADFYPALADTYPDVAQWYIARVYGDGNTGYQALDTIDQKQDARTLADHATDVAPVLSAHFSDLDRAPSEWADAFRIK
jgi:hypothetical protein